MKISKTTRKKCHSFKIIAAHTKQQQILGHGRNNQPTSLTDHLLGEQQRRQPTLHKKKNKKKKRPKRFTVNPSWAFCSYFTSLFIQFLNSRIEGIRYHFFCFHHTELRTVSVFIYFCNFFCLWCPESVVKREQHVCCKRENGWILGLFYDAMSLYDSMQI